MAKSHEKIDPSIFQKDPLECCTCEGQPNEATHEVSIVACKGLDYNKKQDIYRVSYVVCGDCARTLVEVKLNAQLLKRGR